MRGFAECDLPVLAARTLRVYSGLGGGGATFSADDVYRYDLWRKWGAGGDLCVWILLNPSTATHEVDDPTIRRCINFSQAWGHAGCNILNLFSLRSTDPKALYHHPEPIGAANDLTILDNTFKAPRVVCAWGVHGEHLGRGQEVERYLRRAGVRLHHLGLTKDGHPRHPLYLAKTTKLEVWE